MKYETGEAKETNLFQLMKQNERQERKKQLKKVMPYITDSELEGLL